jgi:tetratricopeptide (TPR) repeat protein
MFTEWWTRIPPLSPEIVIEIGQAFGAYRLLERIGEGGVGEVWKALDTRLERRVALKLLKVQNASLKAALIAEAKMSCQLQHPNVAVVFEAGEVNDLPYIAMELVEGATLRSLTGQKRSPDELLSIALQALAGLHHAHRRGVIHRDVKPENFAFDADGTLKVLDFGIAKRAADAGEYRHFHQYTGVAKTEQGYSMGTPAYMSPEQANAAPLSPASDQFSLGVMFWELAAGQRPFQRESLVEILRAIVKDPLPPLKTLRPDLPDRLTQAIDRMLEKKPEDRFGDLGAALAFLEPLPHPRALDALFQRAGDTGAHDTAPPAVPTKRSTWMARGILGFCVAAGFWAIFKAKPLRSSQDALGRDRRVVAVLPVETQGLTQDQSWMGASLQDAMSMGLLRRKDLFILDRLRIAEVQSKVGPDVQGFRKLVAELGAQVLVQSTLQRSDDRLRLMVRLMNAEGAVTEQFVLDGRQSALLELEDSVSRRLPEAFGGSTVTSVGEHSRARQARTRELYAKGVQLLGQGNADASDVARTLFENAVELEPDYAPARAGLAWSLQLMAASSVHLGRQDANALVQRAVQESMHAIALDPQLAFAHRVLSGARVRQGDLLGARVAGQRAVDLDPADFRALAALADAYSYADDSLSHQEARRLFERALELGPDDWFSHQRYAVLLQNDGELEASLVHADLARKLQPSAEYAHLTASLTLLWLGRLEEADSKLLEGLQQVPTSRLLKLTRAVVADARSDEATLRRSASELRGLWPTDHPIGVLIQGLDKPEEAQRLFMAFESQCRARDWRNALVSDRRTAALNLLHMARVLAVHADKADAKKLLTTAEALHPGKLKIASQDPVLKKL